MSITANDVRSIIRKREEELVLSAGIDFTEMDKFIEKCAVKGLSSYKFHDYNWTCDNGTAFISFKMYYETKGFTVKQDWCGDIIVSVPKFNLNLDGSID